MTGPTQDRLALASQGDRHGSADWEKAAAAVLRKSGRLTDSDPDSAVWEALARTTLDGISVSPLGAAGDLVGLPATGEPGAAPYTRGRVSERREEGWDVRTHVAGLAPDDANEAALLDLARGATSLWLGIGDTLPTGGIAAALAGVHLDLAPVALSAPGEPLAAAEALVAVAREHGTDLHPGTNLGVDPLGDAVRGEGHPAAADAFGPVTRLAREAGVLGVVVDGTAVHDLGASDAQELGWSLAVGAAYLRRLVGEGLTVAEALGLLEFRYAATDEQFATIAKLRAARRLWARVAELSGASTGSTTGNPGGGQRQHVVTSRPMMTRYDPWVNMLRTTVAAFAAGVGGADAITVLPFDSALGVPDAFGRRIARNTSALLISESHLATVLDPAGGAYAVEKLTDDLAHAAWAELDRIESAGGVEAALADGSLRSRIETVVAERDAQVARRRRPITGVSEFPNLSEALPERSPAPADDPMTGVRRYAAPYEAMRDEPAGPVFLATMGAVAAHTARASFATNLFAAGGVATESAGPTDGVEDVVAAWRAAGEPVVACLAGTDAAYAEWGTEVVRALREAGAQYLVVAGKPADLGVDDSCAVGVDALAFLTRVREKL